MKVTGEHFLAAFKEAWLSRYRISKDEIEQKYSEARKWTSLIQGEGGVLNETMRILNDRLGLSLTYSTEWYTIDALYLTKDFRGYCDPNDPAKPGVLIEHENGEDIEVEMWKLLFWRCPLKVIIFYDWIEADKAVSANRQNWLGNKLTALREMRNNVNSYFGELADTQYLLVIGSRNLNGEIFWQWQDPATQEKPEVFC